MNKCSFVILNFNDFETTQKCINSIKNYSAVAHIALVDNCSTDDSFERLRTIFSSEPKIDILQTGQNKGYSSGNNFGIHHIVQRYPDSGFIVIANPDTAIKEPALQKLLALMEADSAIGILSPMMIRPNGDKWSDSCWKQPTYCFDLLSAVPIVARSVKNVLKYQKEDFISPVFPVDVVPGSFFVFRKNILENNVLFDEDFFLYCEERVICEQTKKKGFKVCIATDCEYEHYHDKSIGKTYKGYAAKLRLLNTSKKIYYRKYRTLGYVRQKLLFFCFDFSVLLHSLFGR